MQPWQTALSNKIPIRKPQPGEAELFGKLVAMVQAAKRENLDVPAACLRATHRQAFLEELIDACVLAASEAQIISEGNRAKPGSLHFPEEAAAKDLRFMDPVSALLGGAHAVRPGGEASAPPVVEDIETFVRNANAPSHPIRNQLLRLTSASPDLFAVIKQEGAV